MNEDKMFKLLEKQIDKADRNFKIVTAVFTIMLICSLGLTYHVYQKGQKACSVEISQDNNHSDNNLNLQENNNG